MSRRAQHSRGSQVAHSAGGVIYRLADGRIWVALIATSGLTRWGLPKGHVFDGETSPDAARREIQEETGLRGEVLQPLTTIEYWFRAGNTRIHKYVDLFLLRYLDGEIIPQEAEVDDARWFALEDAVGMASFPREQAVLLDVMELWKRGELNER